MDSEVAVVVAVAVEMAAGAAEVEEMEAVVAVGSAMRGLRLK